MPAARKPTLEPGRGIAALDPIPPVALVLTGVTSIQFGAALAATLFDQAGPAGTSVLRLSLAAIVLLIVWRPWRHRHAPVHLRLAAIFGITLGLMNLTFYEALDRIPLGVAVTIEFLGPITVATLLSRRRLDLVWVALATAGILLLAAPWQQGGGLDGVGVALALTAAVFWGMYILLAQRAGRVFDGGEGLAIAMVWAAAIPLVPGIAQAGTDLLAPGLLAAGLGVATAQQRHSLLAGDRGAAADARQRLRRADVARAGARGARGLPDPLAVARGPRARRDHARRRGEHRRDAQLRVAGQRGGVDRRLTCGARGPDRHTGRGVFGLNLPNFLTVLRILLVPVLVVALLGAGGEASDVLAAAVFWIASVTDAIDGWIARSREQVTTFGKLMDPVADKLLVIAALLSLVSLGRLEAWVAMVIIAREFAVTVARLQARAEGVVIAANWWGKAKTLVQMLTIFLLILFDPSPTWVDVLVYAMVAVTIISGIDYFFGMRKLLREAEARRAAHRGAEAPR